MKIRGPKSACRVEMQRAYLQDRTIECRYSPIEPGSYLISIQWSGEHVNGSLFRIHIFEYQEELDYFRHQFMSCRLNERKCNDQL